MKRSINECQDHSTTTSKALFWSANCYVYMNECRVRVFLSIECPSNDDLSIYHDKINFPHGRAKERRNLLGGIFVPFSPSLSLWRFKMERLAEIKVESNHGNAIIDSNALCTDEGIDVFLSMDKTVYN